MDILSVLIFLVTVFVGSLIQGVSGFGFGIFVMTIFPFLLPDYATGITISGMLSIVSTAVISWRIRKLIRWEKLWIPLAANVLLSTIVITFSAGQPDTVLKKLLGVFLILMSIYFIFLGGKFVIRPTKRNGAVAGALGGTLGGFFGMGGPPMVVYLLSSSESNEEYMANIQAFFTVSGAFSLVIRAFNGMMTPLTFQYWGLGLVALGLGVWTSIKLFDRLNAANLKKIVYGFMICSGIIMLWK